MKVQIEPIRVQSKPGGSMQFRSILFPQPLAGENSDAIEVPDFFPDLNLDQVVEAITAGREEYNLKPYFYLPLRDVDSINYCYDVQRDLENPALIANFYSFAQEMRRMRSFRTQEDKLYYERQKQRRFLDAVEIYCGTVQRLNHDVTHVTLHSRGFLGFRGYLSNYVESNEFRTLVADTQKLKHDLEGITYSLHITGMQQEIRDSAAFMNTTKCSRTFFGRWSTSSRFTKISKAKRPKLWAGKAERKPTKLSD
jgi:DNA mismatch repair protein MutS